MALGAFVGLLVFAAAPVVAGSLVGRVVAVSDGDTLTLLDDAKRQHKVRLAGIDAPERRQPFGEVSQQHLARLVFRREVVIDWDSRDRYGRVIGKVLLDGQDVNLAQVEAGMAWHYKRYEHDQSPADRRFYRDAEDAARSARRGLWQDESPVPPWEFRRAARSRVP